MTGDTRSNQPTGDPRVVCADKPSALDLACINLCMDQAEQARGWLTRAKSPDDARYAASLLVKWARQASVVASLIEERR